eukprot:TRINITY_DN13933_c1_g1_i1.p1 TRINITY_DN13933_c1_g1~~TRINITY_DN13933_c1_g1_i1.p1  ORF type:complete len:233 (-),score=26.91 TRINITY_DN13933_c1_g1_i1:138-761(-)
MGSVFVTVGSTEFDALIQKLDQSEIASILKDRGYDELIIQKGKGKYFPRNLVPEGESVATESGLRVEVFDYKPTIAPYIEQAALIISHAGSGSIFEGLSAGRKLVVVPNPILMDNHQVELANHLSDLKYLVYAPLDKFGETLKTMDLQSLVPYERGDPQGIVKHIDQVVFEGVPPQPDAPPILFHLIMGLATMVAVTAAAIAILEGL